MNRFLRCSGLIVLIVGFIAQASGRSVEVEGLAPLDLGSIELARREAIRDALQHAALKDGAHYRSERGALMNGNVLESSALRAHTEKDALQIVREWQEDDLLHVIVHTETPTQCQDPRVKPAKDFKKKILITRFDISNLKDMNDMPDMGSGLARELNLRLQKTLKFRSETKMSSSLLMIDAERPRFEDLIQRIEFLGKESDAQFVIGGRVIDSHTERARWPWQKDRRYFELEIDVFDGLTGTALATHRAQGEAQGPLDMTGLPLGSQSFYSAPYGQAIDSVLSTLTGKIEDELDCLPLSSVIQRVRDRRVYFNAGRLAGLAPGDVLGLYQQNRTFPRQGSRLKGTPETPVGSVRILSVQPQFSIAEILEEATPIDVREGDVVRFELHR